MAALSARKHHQKADITILDRSPDIAKKILVCGGGRCNITNTNLQVDRFYGAPKRFIGSILNQFPKSEIVSFFEDLGVEMYEEEKNGRKKGKLFPITNQATTVRDLLLARLEQEQIEVHADTEVTSITNENNRFSVQTKNLSFESDYLILSAGGKTYPALGSNGSGYDLAKAIGHTIIHPVPSALPLVTDNPSIRRLAGLRLIANVTSFIDNKRIKSDTDELLFTPYGLSGPVILNISREISIRQNREKKRDTKVLINMVPQHTKDDLKTLLAQRLQKFPDQTISHSIYGLVPNKVANELSALCEIASERLSASITQKEVEQLLKYLQSWEVEITGTRGWNEAEFTAGGVDAREINAQTLESKIIPQLYFAGEVVNVDGDVGGFNLSWAWSSGWVAGTLSVV